MQDTPNITSDKTAIGRGQLLLLTAAFEGALLVLGVALGYVLNVPFWTELGYERAVVWGILASTPLIVLVVVLAENTPTHFTRLRGDFVNVVRIFKKSRVPDLLVVSLLAGICEEALFRGFLQNWLSQWGSGFAIAVTALAFGFAHAISLQYFSFAVLMSLYLSLLYVYTGELLAPITLHAAYDFALLVYGTRYWTGRPALAD